MYSGTASVWRSAIKRNETCWQATRSGTQTLAQWLLWWDIHCFNADLLRSPAKDTFMQRYEVTNQHGADYGFNNTILLCQRLKTLRLSFTAWSHWTTRSLVTNVLIG